MYAQNLEFSNLFYIFAIVKTLKSKQIENMDGLQINVNVFGYLKIFSYLYNNQNEDRS